MKKQVTLYIDTTDSTKTVVGIVKNRQKKLYEEKTDQNTKSQNLLPLIEKALEKVNLKLTDLTSIKVNPGPGSFTGVRVGVAVANTLGWALKIPVNGNKIALPKYETSKFDD